MTKTFCDRCGKQIQRLTILDYPLSVKAALGPWRECEYELCGQCIKDFVKWFQEGKNNDA